jgi:hypothetical protein
MMLSKGLHLMLRTACSFFHHLAMGDSWEDAADGRDGAPAPAPAPKLSISAKPFVFNPGAKPFVPPGTMEGASVPAPPPPAPVMAPSPPPPPPTPPVGGKSCHRVVTFAESL